MSQRLKNLRSPPVGQKQVILYQIEIRTTA